VLGAPNLVLYLILPNTWIRFRPEVWHAVCTVTTSFLDRSTSALNTKSSLMTGGSILQPRWWWGETTLRLETTSQRHVIGHIGNVQNMLLRTLLEKYCPKKTPTGGDALRPFVYGKTRHSSFEVLNIHNLLSFGLWISIFVSTSGHVIRQKNIDVLKLESTSIYRRVEQNTLVAQVGIYYFCPSTKYAGGSSASWNLESLPFFSMLCLPWSPVSSLHTSKFMYNSC
jgi:hypothetical protein